MNKIDQIKTISKDKTLISFLSSTFSLILTIIFAVYNLILGIFYSNDFGYAIFAYYLLLTIIRAIILFCEKKIRYYEEDKKNKIRLKYAFIISILLILDSFILIAPIALLIEHKKTFTSGMIVSIAIAAYTTYKVTMAIINLVKKRKDVNLAIRLFTIINITDALVSLLTLQNTLILANDATNDSSLFILSIVSSTIIFLIILTISILLLINIRKQSSNT